MDEIGERVSGRLRSSAPKPRQTRQNGLRLGEVDVPDLVAIPPVPTKRRPLEPRRLGFEQEQDELECVRQADVPEIGRRGKRDPGVPGVERPAQAVVGGAFGCHEQMFAYQAPE